MSKKILLIDLDDTRRATRVQLLESEGYIGDIRDDHVAAAKAANENDYDLVVLALAVDASLASAYAARLQAASPTLPLLILTDAGVYAPSGMQSNDGHDPREFLARVAELLLGSKHVRILPLEASSN